MYRSVLLSSLIMLFAAVSLARSEPEAKPPAKKPDAREADPARELRGKLSRPINLANGIDANTPLRDALEFIESRQDVSIVLDPVTVPFGQDDPGSLGDRPVKLPKMQNVRLSTVLDMLARQTGTAYLVKPGYVEFTIPQRANPVFWGPPNSRGQVAQLIPTVHVDVDRRPLEQVVRDIVESTGINVVLDARGSDPGKTLVTMTLNNVPIDTAVTVLADMSGLKVVYLDNLLYVTTPKNAVTLEAEQAKLRGEGGM
jgi:hypothetical protein